MADKTLNISPPFKFEIKTPPRGMIDYDPSAIDAEQQEELNLYKLNLVRENVSYLALHPEVKEILFWVAAHCWCTRAEGMLPKLKELGMHRKTFRNELREVTPGLEFPIRQDYDGINGEDWDY